MIKTVNLVVVFGTLLIGSCVFLGGQDRGSQSAQLNLRVKVEKRVFKLNQPIDVLVEIENVGKETLFIRKELLPTPASIASLQLTVSNEKGAVSPGVVMTVHPGRPADIKEDFHLSVAKNWLALAPGYLYGVHETLSQYTHKFLSKPGHYRIAAFYRSLGMEANVFYNRLALEPEKIGKLPYWSFKGDLTSNTISIQVVE